MSDDLDEPVPRRALGNSQVLAFIAGYWRRRPGPLLATLALMLVAIGFDLSLPWAAGRLVGAVSTGADGVRAPRGAWMAWLVFVGVYLVYSVVRNTAVRVWTPLAAGNMKSLTDEGFERVQAFSSEWHANHLAGTTVRKLSRAMWGYDMASDAALIFLGPAVVVLVGLCIVMGLRWPVVGLFTAAIVALYAASNVFLTARYARPANRRAVAFDGRIGGAIADAITSNASVKSFGAEADESSRLRDLTGRWHDAVVIAWSRFVNLWLLHNLLLVVLQAGLTGLMLWLWMHGEASAADVAYVVTAFMLISGHLQNLGENIRTLQKGLDDVQDVAAFARTAPEVVDRPDAYALTVDAGGIVFERVGFRYAAADAPLYRDFDLRVAPHEKLAIVGGTGAGKSTLVRLLQRLHDVDAGRILVDGQDIAGVTQRSLRRAIALVPQDPSLFHRTVAENIAYGRPDASDDAIETAARQAMAHDFIARLPNGYRTLVGERGVKLSAGERQRIAIARAFLVDAPILVLDEATSSLDVKTERDVQRATDVLMEGRTTIVIAHRLYSVRRADRIVVMDHGRIVEQGTHDALLARGGVYARLHRLMADGGDGVDERVDDRPLVDA